MKTLLLALTICLLVAVSKQQTSPVCRSVNICGNPALVDCTRNVTSCSAGQVLRVNGALCGCCNACYTLVGSGGACRSNPAQGLYYQCPAEQSCGYNGYCT